MRLLDKKIISSDFALQKKAQIDEGIIIARKVDVLRETLASLEKQYATILSGSRKSLEFAIADLVEKKANVEGELRKLEERKQELNKIIDEKYAVSNEEKINFANKLADLTIKELEVNERESEIAKTEEVITKTKDELTQLKADATRERGKAEEDRATALRIRQDVEADRDNGNRQLMERSGELDKRTEQNANQQRYLELRKQTMDEKEKELNDREKAINDKYETLIRTINRFNKQK